MLYLDLNNTHICSGCKIEKPSTLEYYHSKGNYKGKRLICCICKECRKGENKRYYNTIEKREKYNKSKRKYRNTKGRIKGLLKSYRERDLKKNLEFNLTEEWFRDNILNKSCFYCKDTNLIGVDRIDNNLGHIISNCIPCCSVCNSVRNSIFTIEEMKELGNLIQKLKQKRTITKYKILEYGN